MRELMEEYGGVISAAAAGMIIIGIVLSLVSDQEGALRQSALAFFAGVGLW